LTIQRNWQHWVHKTQDKDKKKTNKQTKQNGTKKHPTQYVLDVNMRK